MTKYGGAIGICNTCKSYLERPDYDNYNYKRWYCRHCDVWYDREGNRENKK